MKIKNSTLLAWLCLIFTMPFISSRLNAQAGRSNLTGIIKNDRGDHLSNAQVIVNGKNSNLSVIRLTYSPGAFHFSGLPTTGSFTMSYDGYYRQADNC